MFNFLASFLHGYKVPVKLYWDPVYEDIIELQNAYSHALMDYWLTFAAGRWYWWFLLFWSVFPLFIWWKYTDRKRFLEVSFFGVMISISAGILDAFGVFTGAWSYPYKLLPFMPNFFPIDYVIVPVVFLLVYQKYTGWKGFVIAVTLISAFLSLILDPVIVWMNLYQPFWWNYYYSVPVFLFMACFSKWVTMVIAGQQYKYGGSDHGNQAA